MKSKILISKSEINPKIKCSNNPNRAYRLERDMLCFDHSNFSYWVLFRNSNFVLRILRR
jgi:hypothetical protein